MSDGGTVGRPRITVVTPSFNQAAYIEETIESVLAQSYPNLEYMVIDGGSTDGSVEIIKKYARSLTYWVSEPDRGQTHAINKGLARATGEIFAYLNSDDLYLPGALQAVADGFAAHPAAAVVYGKCVYIDAEGRELETRQASFNGFEEYLAIWRLLAKRQALTQPEVFCRTAALRRVGEFRGELRFVMDFEMWARLLLAGMVFQSIDQPVAKFRVYQNQKSTSAGEELYRIVRQLYDEMVAEHPERAQSDFLHELHDERLHWLFEASFAAGRSGSRAHALALVGRALRIDPRVI